MCEQDKTEGKQGETKPVGVQDGIFLREQLATTKDPRSAIKQFVSGNSLRTPSCTPAHELLDLMGLTRATYGPTLGNTRQTEGPALVPHRLLVTVSRQAGCVTRALLLIHFSPRVEGGPTPPRLCPSSHPGQLPQHAGAKSHHLRRGFGEDDPHADRKNSFSQDL
jgi:hypothetical protein